MKHVILLIFVLSIYILHRRNISWLKVILSLSWKTIVRYIDFLKSIVHAKKEIIDVKTIRSKII